MKKVIGMLGLLMIVLSFLSLEPASAKSKIDIVFIIDRSGSMGDDIDDVRRNVGQFVDKLSAQGFDYQLGLVSYESNPKRYALTNNVETFKDNLRNIDVGGGTENGLDAIMEAINRYVFELNSFKYFVLIGDEKIYSDDGYSLGYVQQKLIDHDIVLTSVATPGSSVRSV